jgi:hypothetical protein
MQLLNDDTHFHVDPAGAGRWLSLDMAVAARTSLPVLISAPSESALQMAIEIAVGPDGHGADGVVVIDAADSQYLQSTLMRAAGAQLGHVRAVVVHDVDALDQAQQSALTPLVAGARGCRIISTTSVPLFERVLQGSFDAGLFYALNTIHIKVGDLDSQDDD